MKPRDEKEKERLEPGTAPQTKPLPPRSRKRNAAALPGSQNADLRGAKRDRKPKGAGT